MDWRALMLVRRSDTTNTQGKDYDRFAYSDAGALTQFGAFVEVLQPGATSSDRHWHTDQDEFLYLLTGEAILQENDGEHLMRPGDAACWKAGEPNGHRLVNRSDAPCSFVVVGTRTPRDTVHYSDIDRVTHYENRQYRVTRRDGTPIEEGETP
ncbi:MAG: cupin domain-containing protein [Pseudooceanicola sp.]|nr:cupin domain-containing protein [Pseudooceanicola sp.]